jgi:hypothetical protein
MPFDRYDRRNNIIMYAGVSSHVADTRGRQDFLFEDKPADVVLAHLTDLSGTVTSDKIRSPALTDVPQVFHTDAGDVIALACLETSAEGGDSKLSSSWTVYNELARTRPDLIETLSQPWPADKYCLPFYSHVVGREYSLTSSLVS